MARYRFSEFVLSPRRRVLVRDGREQPLIPRYFDLLVFLVEHRHEAVHRRDIFDRVWSDVVVSDSALSQAIRTIRRTLDDDSREPRFIRTVSRHGYRFVFDGVVEEDDEQAWPAADVTTPPEPAPTPSAAPVLPAPDRFEPLLARLTRVPASAADDEDQREAAELLHALGIAETLTRLGTRPRHAYARALLRDARWDTPAAGDVPVLAAPSPAATAWHLTALRLRRAALIAAARWAGAALGGGVAGAFGGAAGGLLLAAAPTSTASVAVVPVLAVVGAACGAAGGAGVGAGLSVAEATFRSRRTLGLVAGGAVGGGLVGLIAEWLSRWTLAALVGVHLDVGGGIEGLAIGGAAGLGYAAATAFAEGGLAAPRGWRRVATAAVVGFACAAATLALALSGRALVGGTVHLIATTSQGSQVVLTPLGRLIGEPGFGPVSAAILGLGEGLLFGAGLAFGLTRRPQ
ncbi:MAG TPA: transcriptional regulator [Vicinamibacterales bacterium]|nr:transcriptional regulator [Vicinamibacterales bacterium]